MNFPGKFQYDAVVVVVVFFLLSNNVPIIIILTVKFKYLCVVNVAGKGEGKKQKKYGGPVMEKSLRVTTRYRYMSNGP